MQTALAPHCLSDPAPHLAALPTVSDDGGHDVCLQEALNSGGCHLAD